MRKNSDDIASKIIMQAAVLVCKNECRIFDQPIEDTNHLPHDGYEADLGRFSAGLEPLIEGSEDNFKVTTPADLARFEYTLARSRMLTGQP